MEDLVQRLNDDPQVHGILVQLPLPGGLDEEKVLSLIRIEKDVDGFHPVEYWPPGAKRARPALYPLYAGRGDGFAGTRLFPT